MLKFFENSLALCFNFLFFKVLSPRKLLYMAARSIPGALPSPSSLFYPFVKSIFSDSAIYDFLSSNLDDIFVFIPTTIPIDNFGASLG
jgi:hypothetical protein